MPLTIADSISTAANALARRSSLDYTAKGISGPLAKPIYDEMANMAASPFASALGGTEEEQPLSFEDALLEAMEGVNAYQAKSEDLIQQMIVDPDSVDAQDVTIAMAEANLALNLAKTILSRVVTAWKDVINTR
jgi:flagellar hook-basal body complex protein FliE